MCMGGTAVVFDCSNFAAFHTSINNTLTCLNPIRGPPKISEAIEGISVKLLTLIALLKVYRNP